MLFFLWFCAKQKYHVISYVDKAEGTLGKGRDGKEQMLTVTLYPVVCFEGDTSPPDEVLTHLHEMAHESCFIANSVKTKIEISLQAAKLAT